MEVLVGRRAGNNTILFLGLSCSQGTVTSWNTHSSTFHLHAHNMNRDWIHQVRRYRYDVLRLIATEQDLILSGTVFERGCARRSVLISVYMISLEKAMVTYQKD